MPVALAAHLAHGKLMKEAVYEAQQYVVRALRGAFKIGRHAPLNFRV